MDITNKSTLIILDWDDTLFPTSWINKNNIEFLSAQNKTILYNKYFYRIDDNLYNLLSKLTKCGTVIIITNALLNWIDMSINILPKTSKLLKNNNIIKIVSARGDFSHYTHNMTDWKKLAFKRELYLQLENKKINNIISIGDAEYEYIALINLYENNKQNYRLLKSIKFKRNPDIYDIDEQLQITNNAIINVCKHKKHLDLVFSNKL
jgi:hypothetical protein